MDSKRELKEFNVLGYNIRLKSEEDSGEIAPEKIIEYVQGEIDAIKQSSPSLENAQAAVLVALKIASEKLGIERDYQENITKLKASAKDALGYIEEVSPSTM